MCRGAKQRNFPSPVAKGREKSELRERREKIQEVAMGRTEELLAFPFWACMKANDSRRAAETVRGYCRWSSQEWRAPEETKAILIGHWITIWLLHRENSGVVLSVPKGQLQHIHVALLLSRLYDGAGNIHGGVAEGFLWERKHLRSQIAIAKRWLLTTSRPLVWCFHERVPSFVCISHSTSMSSRMYMYIHLSDGQ